MVVSLLFRHCFLSHILKAPSPGICHLAPGTLISNCLFDLLCVSPSPRPCVPPERTLALASERSSTQPRARHRAGPEFPLPFNCHFEPVFSSAPAGRLRGSQVCFLSPFLRPCFFNFSFLDLLRTRSSRPRPFQLRLHLTHSDPTPIIQAYLPSKPRGSKLDYTSPPCPELRPCSAHGRCFSATASSERASR